MIQQAEEFEVHGVKLKGKLTCGENVADLGGLKLALRALHAHLKVKADDAAKAAAAAGGVGKDDDDRINGLTPIQRFFLGNSHTNKNTLSIYQTPSRYKKILLITHHSNITNHTFTPILLPLHTIL